MSIKKYEVIQIPTGVWKQNCYIIYDNLYNGILIDPGADSKKIEEQIIKKNIKLKAILNTHGHYDHIGAVNFFKKKYSIPFYLHSKDEKLSKSANLYVKIFESDKFIEIPSVDYFIDDLISPIVIQKFKFEIIFSSGHTMGSVCFLLQNMLFTGDTILPGEIGRTDLPGGNKDNLIKSLRLLSELSGDVLIYPGHGPISSMSNEIENINKFISINAS